MSEIENLRAAIAALKAQKDLLGEAVVETAILPLQEKLAALESPSRPNEPQLKLITILFSDIVGSTQFSQRLDPEDIQGILNGALQRFQEVIKQHGGRVVRFMGDGFKAVFGAPVSLEDDAARAIQAGLDLIKTAKEYGAKLQAEWGIEGFIIRVGINTGQVMLGGGVEADNNAVGMAVNLGARMESLASPGCVLITQETYRQVHGLFNVQEQPPAKVKGSDEPVRTFIVVKAREKSFSNVTRGLEGIETALVGRRAEMSRLQEHFKRVAQEKTTQIVNIIGEAGVGKSRLMLEFESWIARSGVLASLFKGRCSEQTSTQPYSLLRSMFAYSFNILESDAQDQMRRKLEQRLGEHLSGEPIMKAHFIGALSGYDFSDSPHLLGLQGDPQQIRDRALYYLAEYFNAQSEQKPVVLFLDDIHWADTSSLDAILTLSQKCQGLLIVCLARQTVYEKYPTWGSTEDGRVQTQDLIQLEALSEDDSNDLVNQILKNIELTPDWLYRLIQSNTEGNPYYIEEIIKNLMEESILVRDADQGGWRIDASRMREVSIPATLTALLQARLDRLEIEEKRTIQQASVVGKTFWDAVLWAMRSGNSSPGIEGEALPELFSLQRRDLVYSHQPSAFAGTQEYSFKHSLLRETAYRMLLKNNRKAYHALVAEWLLNISRTSQREEEYTAIIAEHFDKAGEVDRAVEWYLQAGMLANAKASAREALAFYNRALALIPEQSFAMRWSGLLGKNEALGILGETKARLEADRELVELAQLMGDDQCLGEAYYRQGFYLGRTGDYAGESLAYDRALEYAGRAGDHNLEARILSLKAILLSRQGDLQAATLAAEKALSLARSSDRKEVLAQTLINAGFLFSEAEDISKSIQFFEEGVRVSEILGNRQRVITCLGNLGYTCLRLGLFQSGLKSLQRTAVQAHSNGYMHNFINAQLNTGLCLIRMEELEKALILLDQTAKEASQLGDTFSQAVCHTYSGLALEQKGQMDDARPHFADAYCALSEMGVHSYAMDALAGMARCDLFDSQLEQAKQGAAKIWEYLEVNGPSGLEAPILAYLTCINAFTAIGDSKSALAVLDRGFTHLSEQAAQIENPEWKKAFLDNFAEHREIIRLKNIFDSH